MTHIEGDLVIGHDASLTEHKTNYKIVLNGEKFEKCGCVKKYLHNVRIYSRSNYVITFSLVTTDPSNYMGKNVVATFKEMSSSGMVFIPASGSFIVTGGTYHPVYNITYNHSSDYLVIWYDVELRQRLETNIVFECDFVTEL
jgi:predicted 2-oxoglutarate/Fe(II)-dependent dioxygenase YbiX